MSNNYNWSVNQRRHEKKPRFRPGPPPPGLQYHEIRAYYNNLRKIHVREKKEKIVKFTIPPSVLKYVSNNLKSIAKVAESYNICLPQIRKTKLYNREDSDLGQIVKDEIYQSIKEEKDQPVKKQDQPSDEEKYKPVKEKKDQPEDSNLSQIVKEEIYQPVREEKDLPEASDLNQLVKEEIYQSVKEEKDQPEDSGLRQLVEEEICQPVKQETNQPEPSDLNQLVKQEMYQSVKQEKDQPENSGLGQLVEEEIYQPVKQETNQPEKSDLSQCVKAETHQLHHPKQSEQIFGSETKYMLEESKCDVLEVEPSTSSTHDFIPVSNAALEYGIEKKKKQFNQRGAGNLKWVLGNHDKSKEMFVLKSKYMLEEQESSILKIEPSTSSAPDFIPVREASLEYNEVGSKQLYLRSAGEYKYSYKDIITGTFEEKLDESLSKGISINMTNSEINDINVTLLEEYKEMCTKPQFKTMLKFREKLPTYQKLLELSYVINNNQVVVISGDTGCGKSTQIPQIILDNAICTNRGGNVKIVVTQPRRIAASSLAKRVAQERAENMGNSVGYAVRLEKVDSRPRGSIVFVTTGILLADLEVNQGLTNYSHVILDEAHERDSHIDLSMCMLKLVLKKRKDLKLILMSATIDADRLSAYFDNCPMVHIDGLAYPVKDYYLEDVLEFTKFRLPFNFAPIKTSDYFKQRKKNGQYMSEIGTWLWWKKWHLSYEVYETLKDSRIEDVPTELIIELLIFICRGKPGAILVFLPGIVDITKLLMQMERSNAFPKYSYEIYPLHSKLPTLEQHKIFERPPTGIRKIIVSTNIAETSITIDDIVYVIDCGKIKMSGLNIGENVATLNTVRESKANLIQRRGRAGRCQPGVCYHLLTSFRAQQLDDRVLPELQRSNLLEQVLTIKRLRLGKAAEALSMVPDPPASSTIEWAVKHLQQCGALDEDERLTPLGWHLARLPVHPAAGKLLLLGALFGCLDRAASVAAVWGFKDPFMLVIGQEAGLKKAKRRLSLGEPSDHVAISEAIINWERCENDHQREKYANENFLSSGTLYLLSEMKQQLGDSLKQMGFLASGDVRSLWENRNSDNLSLFKAIVAAALYPNVAIVNWTNLHVPKRKTPLKIQVCIPREGVVYIHQSSIMGVGLKDEHRGPECKSPGANWLVYWLKQRSKQVSLFEVTLVYTLPLLFFGELEVTKGEKNTPDECYISVASTKVRCKKETADIIIELRSLLDLVLASKVDVASEHTIRHNEFEELVLKTVIKLITAEDSQVAYLQDDDEELQNPDVSANKRPRF